MRVACKLLMGIALLQGAAYAQQQPQIDVVDGKISMTAQAVPLGRLLTLFGRAVGMEAKVKPGLENQNISVMFTGLKFNDAVRKIFEGRNLNYVVVQGKAITVTELADASAAPTSSSPSFSSGPAFAPPPTNLPQNPVQTLPATNPFGGTPTPAIANTSPAPVSGPGMAPPPIGASNPLINPVGGGPVGGGNNPTGNMPPSGPTGIPSQPSGPGTVGGTPGALPPGTIR